MKRCSVGHLASCLCELPEFLEGILGWVLLAHGGILSPLSKAERLFNELGCEGDVTYCQY